MITLEKKKNSIWLWFRLGIALWSYLYDWYFEDDGSLNNIEKTFRINFLPIVLSIVCCRIVYIRFSYKVSSRIFFFFFVASRNLCSFSDILFVD